MPQNPLGVGCIDVRSDREELDSEGFPSVPFFYE